MAVHEITENNHLLNSDNHSDIQYLKLKGVSEGDSLRRKFRVANKVNWQKRIHQPVRVVTDEKEIFSFIKKLNKELNS